jgi:hypothetical protein
MSHLTLEERRRIFVSRAQQSPNALAAPPRRPIGAGPHRTAAAAARRRRALATIAVIVTLVASGSIAWGTVEFRRPLSLLETVLPRA